MCITLTVAAAKTLPELINEFITRKKADEYHRLCQQKFDEAECRTYGDRERRHEEEGHDRRGRRVMRPRRIC